MLTKVLGVLLNNDQPAAPMRNLQYGLRATHQNDVIILLDFLHELLETLLKLSPVLGTSHQQTHVKSDHLHTFIDVVLLQMQVLDRQNTLLK